MRAYLAVSAEAQSIVGQLIAAADRWRSSFLPDEAGPWSSRTWISSQGRAGIVAWTNESVDTTIALFEGTGRALGVPGHLVDRAGYRRLLEADDPGDVADQLAGVFSVFRADERGVLAATTLARADPVYYGSYADFGIVSNRAVAVHIVARSAAASRDDVTPSIRYNLAATQELARTGWFLSDETPFEGVRALSPHTTVRIDGARTMLQRRAGVDSDTVVPRGSERRRQLQDLAERVLVSIAPLTDVTEPIRLSLTGGRDSRLIAAALHASRVPFATSTNGFSDHPDVILAAQISRVLGVEHRAHPPKQDRAGDVVIVEHPVDRACHAIRNGEGMVSAHNSIAKPARFRDRWTIAGLGGEQLRGGFLLKQTTLEAAALHRSLHSLFLGNAGFMTDQANARARTLLAPWAERAARSSAAVLDQLYLHYRLGRWAVAARAATSMSVRGYFPLLDNLLMRRAMALSPAWRWSEEPLHWVISKLVPALRDVPLEGRRWRYEASPPRFAFARLGRKRRSVIPASTVTASFDWRGGPDPDLIAILREQILDGPAALFEVVNRTLIERLLTTYPLQQPAFVWSVFTTSLLLSGRWLVRRSALPELTVTIQRREPARADGRSTLPVDMNGMRAALQEIGELSAATDVPVRVYTSPEAVDAARSVLPPEKGEVLALPAGEWQEPDRPGYLIVDWQHRTAAPMARAIERAPFLWRYRGGRHLVDLFHLQPARARATSPMPVTFPRGWSRLWRSTKRYQPVDPKAKIVSFEAADPLEESVYSGAGAAWDLPGAAALPGDTFLEVVVRARAQPAGGLECSLLAWYEGEEKEAQQYMGRHELTPELAELAFWTYMSRPVRGHRVVFRAGAGIAIHSVECVLLARRPSDRVAQTGGAW